MVYGKPSKCNRIVIQRAETEILAPRSRGTGKTIPSSFRKGQTASTGWIELVIAKWQIEVSRVVKYALLSKKMRSIAFIHAQSAMLRMFLKRCLKAIGSG